jgi:hypothetical protein
MAIDGLRSGGVVAPGQPKSQAAAVPTWVFKAVPNDTEGNTLSNQAVDLLKQGNAGGAIELLKKALALNDTSGKTDVGTIFNRLGVAYNRLDDQGEALRQFQNAKTAVFEQTGGGFPPASYNTGVSVLKQAIAESGQGANFKADKASVNPALLDPRAISTALESLGEAIKGNADMFKKMAREDTDWAPLVNDAKFRALVDLPARVATTKDELAAPATAAKGESAAQTAETQQWFGKNQKPVGY